MYAGTCICMPYLIFGGAAMHHFYDEHALEFLHNVPRTLYTFKRDIYRREEGFGFPAVPASFLW